MDTLALFPGPLLSSLPNDLCIDCIVATRRRFGVDVTRMGGPAGEKSQRRVVTIQSQKPAIDVSKETSSGKSLR